ncbi:hypothetical protein ACYOEI_13435 [Singulisphaera rosea]
MRISFDLDDTLVCYRPGALYEPHPPWYRRLLTSREPLRMGSRSLMHSLEQQGWEIWIYTTSYRTPASVRRWLGSYGIRIRRVINRRHHDRQIRQRAYLRPPSKDPAAFDIDLHVDDSEGVRLEGERENFRVVVVAPENAEWAKEVLSAADAIRPRSNLTA